MATNYFESRYLTLVGHVQSGKTIEEINYCYESVCSHNVPVVFIVRNIRADQLQLRERFLSFTKLNVDLLSNMTIQKTVEFMENSGVVILLCNSFQLIKIKRVIETFSKPFHLCIDEVDFSIKSRDLASNIDINLNFIKRSAKHILGATATPFALFFSDKSVSKVQYLNPNKKYQGIEKLQVNFVEFLNAFARHVCFYLLMVKYKTIFSN